MQNTLHTGKIGPRKISIPAFLLRRRNLIVEIIAALHIVLFVYTGINKLLVLDDLKLVLKDYPLIGGFSNMIAWSIPIAELLVASLLLIPQTKLRGLISSVALMTFFTLYLGYIMIFFSTKLPCTCGGMLQVLTWPQHLIFNLLFIMLALAGIKLNLYRKT